jgi:c(7)-type cytochrome triheme protein
MTDAPDKDERTRTQESAPAASNARHARTPPAAQSPERDARLIQSRDARHARRTRGTHGPRLFARACLLLAAAGLFFFFVAGRRAPASTVKARASAITPAPNAAAQSEGSRFSHAVAQHASQSCDSCHRREGNEAQPRLPGHKACIDCHATQFTTPGSPLCLGCHTNVESNNPPVKDFPGLKDFGMRFDHASHMSGAAHPEQGCTACHAPARRGVALTIPAGLAAHNECYQCHTPNAQAGGRQIGSCNTCHALGGYGRVSTAAAAYRVHFSHAGHGPRQGLRCDECHQVRSGVPRTQQVTAPQPTQHFGSGRGQSCMTCHNNRRAFGGEDFASCKRCHTGQTFRF